MPQWFYGNLKHYKREITMIYVVLENLFVVAILVHRFPRTKQPS